MFFEVNTVFANFEYTKIFIFKVPVMIITPPYCNVDLLLMSTVHTEHCINKSPP